MSSPFHSLSSLHSSVSIKSCFSKLKRHLVKTFGCCHNILLIDFFKNWLCSWCFDCRHNGLRLRTNKLSTKELQFLFRTECAKKKVFLEVYAILTPKIFLLAKDFFFVVVDIWFALIMFSNKNTHSVGLRH